MSLSKPAVVTDFGGNPYVITDGVNGLLVEKKNPHAMAEAILRLVRDPGLLDKLRRGAKSEFEKKFTSEVMTAQIEKLYQDDYERAHKKK